MITCFSAVAIGQKFTDMEGDDYTKHSVDTAIMVNGEGYQDVFYPEETVLVDESNNEKSPA